MHRLHRAIRDLSLPMRVGIFVLLMGGGLDVIYHAPALIGQVSLDAYLGENGVLAHLVTFLGMAVTLFGVVTAGLTQVARRGLSGRLALSPRHSFNRGKEN